MKPGIIMMDIFLILLLILIFPCSAAQMPFPPEQGPYTGDYVLIDEPGRYTLEENISHSYPVGIIITSSSVILDGQGRYINPVAEGDPSVGIWIAYHDKEGNPLTGIKIDNCNIADEVTGIYVEGFDSSEFPWGSRSDETTNFTNPITREVKLSTMQVTGCSIGLATYEVEKPSITKSEFRDNEKGLLFDGGTPEIHDLVISNNGKSGITLKNTLGGEISGSRIEGNTDAGIILENAQGTRIWNNILDNYRNIQLIGDTSATLNTTLKNATNIINGPVTGGNLWSQGGTPVYIFNKITDEDNDGIGDTPYISVASLMDHYPLIPKGSAFSIAEPEIMHQPSVINPTPIPTPFSIITGIHAAIVGDTIPDEMETDTKYEVELTILNDGSDDWLLMHAVGVRASGEAAAWGSEWMPVTSVIPSKKPFSFTFTIHTPKKPGTYELIYQAIRSGQGVSITFGRPYKKVVIVK
ncbi:MAG: hypothetical protein GXY48_15015 [Methanomicrobiales archaeon]|nr:hypothetical protein [Methanomicrobiales archaeon]